ncbi:MAG: hypothetical protein Roseis2KO_33640 [Roseivirga sp.]
MKEIEELSPVQQMLAFSFLADLDEANILIDKQKAQDNAFNTLTNALADKEIKAKMGGWTCIHKPWITYNLGQERNLTAVFQSEDGKQIVVAVAGTNFINRYDWFTEDVETETLLAWGKDLAINQPGSGSDGCIATGTAIALQTTWNEKDVDDKKGQTLVEWLSSYLSSTAFAADSFTLSVTGHSLGGAIAPVLAQALSDNQSAWCPSDKTVKIVTYPFAGPTPGDEAFQGYMEGGPVEIISTYNKFDVVPHAWELSMIDEISGLFDGALLNSENYEFGHIVSATVNWVRNKAIQASQSGHKYLRWNNENVFGEAVQPLSEEEITRVGYLTAAIEAHLKLQISDRARKGLYKVCGLDENSKVDDLHGYLIYFSGFLSVLGREHITEYQKLVLADADFVTALNKYQKMGATDLPAGLAVLNQLFIDISA